MADIFDGLEKTPQQELVNLVATYDVYNPGNEVKVLFKRIGNFFKWLFKMYYRPVSMSCQYENRRRDLSSISRADMINILKQRMFRTLILTGKFPAGRSDDRLSVCTINALTSIYRGPQYKYMSPAEKADELKRKCYLRNANIIKRLPVIWLILAALILVGAIICGCIIFPWKIVLPSTFGLELIIYLFFKRRLAFEKLSRTMALSGRYLGQIFSVSIDELSIRKKENGGNFEKGLRALHSIEIRMQENGQKKEELEVEKKEFTNSLQQVEGSLRKYSENRIENGMDINDLRNIEKELLLDRDRLYDEITQADITITELSNAQSEDKNLYEILNNLLLSDIRNYWSGRYNMFRFGDDFYKKLVQGFEWHSFDLIEKRLIELASMDDPTAIGKKKAGCYRFHFGIRGKLCSLTYTVKGNDVNVTGIERGSPVFDVGMSDREIHDTLELYDIILDHHDDNDQLIKELKQKIASTKARLAETQNAYEETRKMLDSAEVESRTLQAEKKSLEKEIDRYKRAIAVVMAKTELDNEQKDKLISQLNNKITELENDKAEKDTEYWQVIAKCEELKKNFEDQKSQLEAELLSYKQLEEKLNKEIKESEDKIAKLTDEVQSSNNQVNFLQSTLDKLTQQQNSPGYQKLKLTVEKQKEQIKEKNKKIKGQQERIREYREEIKVLNDLDAQVKAKIKKYEEDLVKAHQENEELKQKLFTNKMYEDRDIREQFLEAVAKAKKEVDIICPWVGNMAESNEFLKRVEQAVKVGVVIKIVYGIGDNSGRSENNNVSRTALRSLIERRERIADSNALRSVRDIYYLHRRFERIRRGCIRSLRSDTHAKLVIVDNDYFMIGSFNFLSFEGKYNDNDRRKEIVIKSMDKATLESLRSRFFNFTENKPDWITDDLGDPLVTIR